MSTTIEIRKAMLSPNKTLVDENNLEIEPNSIIHCLGSLFQVMDTGLMHERKAIFEYSVSVSAFHAAEIHDINYNCYAYNNHNNNLYNIFHCCNFF